MLFRSPALATGGELGHHAAEDEDTAQVVKKDPESAAVEEGTQSENEARNPVEFAMRGAALGNGEREWGHKLDAPGRVTGDLGC